MKPRTPWTHSPHCHTRAHCHACRNDPAFRQSILSAGMSTQLDFPCPLGHQIGCRPIPAFGINTPAPSQLQPRTIPTPQGPGTHLKHLLSRLHVTATPTCPCNRHAAEMDTRGPDWCAANIPTILDWLAAEAAHRHLPFSPTLATLLIRTAIRRSRASR
jgi:hypothetical protein